MFYKKKFKRLGKIINSDLAVNYPFRLFYRLLKVLFLIITEKTVIFKVNAKKTTFKFIYKPYKSFGFGGRGQFVYREYYDRFFRVDLDIFKKQFKTFLDIGCSRGFFTTYIAKAYNCQTLSVDVFNYAIKDCKENLELNNINKAILECSAVGSQEDSGKKILLNKNISPSTTSVITSEKIDTYATNSVVMVSIDELCFRHRLKSIDLMKIDVEGYEYEVLEGSLNSIRKYRPIIYLEFNFTRKRLEILNLFEEISYKPLIPLRDGSLTPLQEKDLQNIKYPNHNIFSIPDENYQEVLKNPKNIIV